MQNSTFLDVNDLRLEIAILQENINSQKSGTYKFKIPAIITTNNVSTIYTRANNLANKNALKSTATMTQFDDCIDLYVPLEHIVFYNGDIVPAGTKFIVGFVGGNVNDAKIISRYYDDSVEFTSIFDNNDHNTNDEVASGGTIGSNYSMKLMSNIGTILRENKINCEISCTIYNNTKDITSEISKDLFIWTRQSADTEADNKWNTDHQYQIGSKLNVTYDDIGDNKQAIFFCSVTINKDITVDNHIEIAIITDQISIKQIQYQYGISSDINTPPDEWSFEIPADEDGKAIWIRDFVTLTDGVTYTMNERIYSNLINANGNTYGLYIETPMGLNLTSTGLPLIAHLYENSVEVTDLWDDSCFQWTRQSPDTYGDIYWNDAHKESSKTLTLYSTDIKVSATFQCKFETEIVSVVS